jgi:hypothetical protein
MGIDTARLEKVVPSCNGRYSASVLRTDKRRYMRHCGSRISNQSPISILLARYLARWPASMEKVYLSSEQFRECERWTDGLCKLRQGPHKVIMISQ